VTISSFVKNLAELGIPLSRSLFKAIQRFPQPANSIGDSRIDTLRQLHINLLMEISMKECIIYIQLMQGSPFFDCNCHENPDCCEFNNRRKSLIIVYAFLLSKSLYHQPGFKPFNTTICLAFNLINSFASNGFLPLR